MRPGCAQLLVLVAALSLAMARPWTTGVATTIPRWGNPTSPSGLLEPDYASMLERVTQVRASAENSQTRPSNGALNAMEHKLSQAAQGLLPKWNSNSNSFEAVDRSHLGPSGTTAASSAESGSSSRPAVPRFRRNNGQGPATVRSAEAAGLNAPGGHDAEFTRGWFGPNATAYTPPDPALAVGPESVITMTNLQAVMYNKTSGAVMDNVHACAIWGATPSGGTCTPGGLELFDPRAVYDVYEDRFILLILDGTSSARSYIQVAVSNDGNPADFSSAHWTLMLELVDGSATSSSGSLWSDYPSLGLDRDNVYVSVNLFTDAGAFSHANILAWKKSDMFAPPAANFPYTTFSEVKTPAEGFFGTPETVGTLTSAVMFGDPGTGVFVAFGGLGSGWGGVPVPTLHMFEVDGASDLSKADLIGVSLEAPTFPTLEIPSMSQPNDLAALDALGYIRMLDSKYIDGTLYATHMITDDSGDFVAVRWYAFDLCSASISHAGNLFLEDAHMGFPALGLGPNGLALVASGSGPELSPSMWVAHRLHTDPLGTMRPSQRLLDSWDYPYENLANNINRYGDYFAGAVDPSDLNKMWVYGEMPSDTLGDWSTFVQEVDLCPDCEELLPACGACEDSPIADGPDLTMCPASVLSSAMWSVVAACLVALFAQMM